MLRVNDAGIALIIPKFESSLVLSIIGGMVGY